MTRLQTLMLATAATLLLFAGTAHAQISFNVHIGTPPPPPQAYAVPVQPGPDYTWVEGYWYPSGGHYLWHNGYWTHPPYAGAYWVAPYYNHGQYYAGRWEGSRGNVYHNHSWDKSPHRDEHHEPQHRGGRS